MRVAVLTANAQAGDAIGNQVAEKLAFFLERGADVRVLVESGRRLHPAVQVHCRVLRGPKPDGEDWEFLRSADLVIVEYAQYFPSLQLLPLLGDGKPRILFDYHGVTPAELWGDHNRESLEKGAQQRGLVWCADVALVHSRFTCQELRGHTAFPAERLFILEHPVDTGYFCRGSVSSPCLLPPDGTQARGSRGGLRDQLGLRDASLLLFVGRLAMNKRVPVLIEALNRLRDRTPPVHLILIGDATDIYQVQAGQCAQRAAELGLTDRVHFLGHVREDQLLDAYRSADLFVMPSRHEGFCIPVIEAMACGLPVIAARAGALPETVASAGLTFVADDPGDLALQVRRVLGPRADQEIARPAARTSGCSRRRAEILALAGDQAGNASLPPSRPRVAIVAPRYGSDFAGGAERSLRTIASTLHAAGCTVEVFTIGDPLKVGPANEASERTVQANGIPLHRFRADHCDLAQQREAIRSILQADGHVAVETERLFLDHTIRSTPLLEALRQRFDHWDAVIVGPYLYGLTFDIARAFPEKTLLLPCFHDEPFARLGIWREAYREVGGILYHSHEEKELAEVELGLNHPGAVCIGTFVETEAQGDATRGRALIGSDQPTIVYCGRYLREKNLPMLLDYAQRYQEANPGRFLFAFLGEGELPIPRQPWARDLGFVDESCKRDILAAAAVLAQLSRNESLSLVALEAWTQGVPVLAAADCPVLAGHLRRGGGGRAVEDYPSFAAALDDLWQRPEAWRRMGQHGRDYVRETYGCREQFTGRLLECIRDLTLPLAERMRRQGLLRAAQLERSTWRARFGQIVEELLHSPPRHKREELEVWPRTQSRVVRAGSESVLVPVRIANRGTLPALAEGPGRMLLRSFVMDERGQSCSLPALDTPLPGLLVPGQEASAAMRVPVPETAGTYQVALLAAPCGMSDKTCKIRAEGLSANSSSSSKASLRLLVEQASSRAVDACCADALQAVDKALAVAESKQHLPVDYLDVTQGFLSKWKRWIKCKLLGNFKHAYVDVLSRQQSEFNRQTLAALQELAECCAVLDHARAINDREEVPKEMEPAPRALANSDGFCLPASLPSSLAAGKADELAHLLHTLVQQLAEARLRCAALEARLDRWESERVTARP